MKIEIGDLVVLMQKKISNFFDKHRIILGIFIILIIFLIFLGTNLYIFFNYNFKKLECTSNIDEYVCLSDNIEILVNPDKTKKEIFKEYENSIKDLQDTYDLPDFDLYTAYYYTLASNIDYNLNNRNMTLNNFFNQYSNTYNLEEFYKDNNLFYDVFLPVKLV